MRPLLPEHMLGPSGCSRSCRLVVWRRDRRGYPPWHGREGSSKFMQSYILQTRTGVGNGPLLGYCSTPFSRVVLAASEVRKAGRSFTAADIPPEALASEFHVLLLPQQKAYESDLATTQAVVLIVHIGGQDRVVEPVDTRAAAPNEVAAYTGRTASGATAIRFPMNALVPGSAIAGDVQPCRSRFIRTDQLPRVLGPSRGR